MASSTEVEVGMEKVAVSRKRTHNGRCVKAPSPMPEVVCSQFDGVSRFLFATVWQSLVHSTCFYLFVCLFGAAVWQFTQFDFSQTAVDQVSQFDQVDQFDFTLAAVCKSLVSELLFLQQFDRV